MIAKPCLSHLLAAALAVLGNPALALAPPAPGITKAADPVLATQLHRLRELDLALATAAMRLTTGNAALCRDSMPITGVSLHARDQYPDSISEAVAAVFGFPEPLAVSAVVVGGPADQAGIQPNDGVISVAGLVPPPGDGDGRPDTLIRDSFETALAGQSPTAAMTWLVRREGRSLALQVQPRAGCRVRFEVVPGAARIARNDGQLIQIGAGYVANMSADDLAVIVAHELAHSVMLHRQRMVAAGVSKGLLAEFGRNGRLSRQVEREADRLAVYLLRNGGYDPLGAARFWEGPEGKRGAGLLRGRTHDSASTRARLIRAEIERMPAGPAPVVPAWLNERLQPLR